MRRTVLACVLVLVCTAGLLPVLAPALGLREERTVLDEDTEFAESSGVETFDPSPAQVANLALLGRVWGFLKYHHGLVTSGALHWDFELFRILPDVLDARSEARGREVLTDWALGLGVPEEPRRAARDPLDPELAADLDWIRDEALLTPELSELLLAVHARRSGAAVQFYVTHAPGIGNPIFQHEEAYADLGHPDAGYRLLALFRFWNVVEYWFPYRDLIDEDWTGALVEFAPQLARAASPEDYALALMALIARAKDTHANLWSSLGYRPPAGPGQVPVVTRFIEDREGAPRAVVAGTSRADGEAHGELLAGDVILAVDGTAVEELIERWAPYYAASNPPTRLRDLARSLLRGPLGPVKLELMRGRRRLEVRAERVPLTAIDRRAGATHDQPGETFRLLSPDVAYLKLSSVEAARCPEYVASAQGTKGWVIDIRNYPSEFVPFALGGHLLEESTPFARFTSAHASNPGAFQMGEPISIPPREPRYEGRIVILVDEVSQSQAEYTTMGLRTAPGALVLGSTTAGADGNVSSLPLPGGLGTMISGIGVFYPDGTPTQRVGIVPDVRVVPTIEGLRDGRDELLEEALRQILGEEVKEDEIRRLANGG